MDHSTSRGRTTSRRSLLRRGAAALAGSVALAGCTEDVGEELPANEHRPVADLVPDLPVRERSDVLEAGIEAFADAAFADVEGFVAALEERGHEFESVEAVVELLHLEYGDPELARRGTFEVTGAVAGAYAALVDGGFEARGLELVLAGADGSTVGVVEIATEWALAYNEGALSTAAYADHVAGSIESRRDPPEHDVAPDE